MKYGGQSRQGWRRKVCRRKRRRESNWGRKKDRRQRPRFQCSFAVVGGRRGRNRHHMTNKRCGGKKTKWNILWMKIRRHRSLHHYFGNLKWEVIGDVIYYGTMRERKAFRGLSDSEIGDVLFSIFHKRDPMACVEVIDRVSLAKGRVTREKERKAA